MKRKMKRKYSVLFTKQFDLNIEVEAENKDEAMRKAEDILNNKRRAEALYTAQEGGWETAYADEVE